MNNSFWSKSISFSLEKSFLFLFLLLVIGSVLGTYYRTMIKKDYPVIVQTECDPYTEKCFVHICDPSPEVDGGVCTGDSFKDTWFTKNITRKASNIPLCDPNDNNCLALICQENESDCEYELCNENNVPNGDSCNDTEEYIRNGPPIERLQDPST
jgi:hypothetical protein